MKIIYKLYIYKWVTRAYAFRFISLTLLNNGKVRNLFLLKDRNFETDKKHAQMSNAKQIQLEFVLLIIN